MRNAQLQVRMRTTFMPTEKKMETGREEEWPPTDGENQDNQGERPPQAKRQKLKDAGYLLNKILIMYSVYLVAGKLS